MSIIEMNHVYLTYNEHTDIQVEALKNVSLKVDKGDFLAIMGESGSGKSTLLNVLTAMLKATNGEVIFDGKSLSEMNDTEIAALRYSTLSYIFQDFNLLNNLTIFENIALPLMMQKKVYIDDIYKEIIPLCKTLNIEKLLDKYPNECSGGQQQRIAIARTMSSNPKIIVADEPTGNLDSSNMKEIMEQFTQLNQQGITIVMVTHDSKVASYANRMIYIQNGEIIKEITKNGRTAQAYYTEIVSLASMRGEFI